MDANCCPARANCVSSRLAGSKGYHCHPLRGISDKWYFCAAHVRIRRSTSPHLCVLGILPPPSPEVLLAWGVPRDTPQEAGKWTPAHPIGQRSPGFERQAGSPDANAGGIPAELSTIGVGISTDEIQITPVTPHPTSWVKQFPH